MKTLLALTLALTTAHAQTAPPPHAHLTFVLILSRHGIRPPLVEAATLNASASDPWPAWEVPLGHLTPHGADAIRQMGTYLHQRYAAEGLFTTACPAPTAIFLYSDTDERNISSTRSTAEGMFPTCTPLDIQTIIANDTKIPDALFTPVPRTFPAPNPDSARAALLTRLNNNPEFELSAPATPALNDLARILAPITPPAKPILAQPISLTTGTYGISARGPLPSASNLVEDLELEFIDAKPLTEIGWGRLGTTDAAVEATLQKLLPIHIKAFGLALRTPIFARAQASNLAAHILATLQQSDTPTQPIGPATAKLVYISAHDSNLFALGGLLNLHWTADHRTDDTPPDSQLAFELWQRGRHTYIRILYRAQTLTQLRAASPLTLTHPPAESEVTPTGCLAHHPCPLATFLAAAQATLDPAYIQPNLALTQTTPTQPAP